MSFEIRPRVAGQTSTIIWEKPAASISKVKETSARWKILQIHVTGGLATSTIFVTKHILSH